MIYEITVGIEQTFGCWYVYFHRTDEQSVSGWKRLIGKRVVVRLWLDFFLLEQIQNGFMTSFIIKHRYGF